MGAVSASCSAEKVMSRQIAANAVEGNHIDLSESLLQLRQVPSDIFKDLYKSGFLDKLYLTTNDKDNSMDIRIEEVQNILDFGYQNNYSNAVFDGDIFKATTEVIINGIKASLNTIKLGEVRQGNNENGIHEFYKEDEFLVKNDKDEWVKIDFNAKGQYLPTHLDDKGNLVIEYQLKKHNSDKALTYRKTVETNQEKGALRKEISDLLYNFIARDEEHINELITNATNGLLLAQTYSTLLASENNELTSVLNVGVESATKAIKLVKDLMNKAKNRQLTNEFLTEKYFEVRNLVADVLLKLNDVIEMQVQKVKAISEEEANAKIQELKEFVQQMKQSGQAFSPFSNIEFIERLLAKYDNEATRNEVLLKNPELPDNVQQYINWLVNKEFKSKVGDITVKDMLLLQVTFIDLFKKLLVRP